jgi:hypothetical protein
MHWFHEDAVVPLFVFAIPIVAIAGGVLAGIVKTISTHRLMETALRERMALVARGVDPEQLSGPLGLTGPGSIAELERFRAQGLLVAGFVILTGGAALSVVGGYLDGWGPGDWTLGVVAAAVGLALIASGLIIWPRGKRAGTP